MNLSACKSVISEEICKFCKKEKTNFCKGIKMTLLYLQTIRRGFDYSGPRPTSHHFIAPLNATACLSPG